VEAEKWGALAEAQPTSLADRRARVLSASLGRLGWECTQADVDLVAGTARVCFRSYTGRLVTLDADGLGRVTVTREQREAETVLVGRRGDRMPVERLTTRFLGRNRCHGIRSGMRAVAHYLADNAGVARELVKAPIAALLEP
jgi:hypothetical protein